MGVGVVARWQAPWIVLAVLAFGAAAGARRSEVRMHSDDPLAELICGDCADFQSVDEAIEAVRELDRDLRRLMRDEGCALCNAERMTEALGASKRLGLGR